MNKRDAKKAVYSGDFTWGQLREMVEAAEKRGGPSRVNPQFTIAETCEFYRALLAKKNDADTANASYGYDHLGAINILRDCA